LTGPGRRGSVAAQANDREVSMNGNGGELSSFLTKLGEDPELQQAYTKDPEGTLRSAGLSDETIKAVLSRDLAAIKAVLDRELPGGGYMLFMVLTDPSL
jgi:hypothetical protein